MSKAHLENKIKRIQTNSETETNMNAKNTKFPMDQTKFIFFISVSADSSPNRLEIYEYFEATQENLNRFNKFDCSCKVS